MPDDWNPLKLNGCGVTELVVRGPRAPEEVAAELALNWKLDALVAVPVAVRGPRPAVVAVLDAKRNPLLRANAEPLVNCPRLIARGPRALLFGPVRVARPRRPPDTRGASSVTWRLPLSLIHI